MKRFFLCLPLLFAAAVSAEVTTVSGRYFGETGCGHCDAFLRSGKADYERRYGVSLALETRDILKAEDYALCVRLLEARGRAFRVFPVLFIGENVYQGDSAIQANLGPEIEHFLREGRYRPTVADLGSGGGFSARLAPVLAAGLLDGVNPCAFSTLLFFLSFLTLRGRSRRSVLAVGAAFILSVFAVYFLIGLGLLGGLRKLGAIAGAALALNVFVSALSALLGVLSVRDALRARMGRPEDAALKLPEALSRANHFLIRRLIAGPAALLGAVLAGVAVSVLELACTGQIYLPTLAYLNRSAPSARGVSLLLAYNAAFVLPLAAVFAAFFFGTAQERIRAWYRGRIFAVRLLTALFFFSMGALIWLV